MTKEEFKVEFIELFSKHVKIELSKGITFDFTGLTDKLVGNI